MGRVFIRGQVQCSEESNIYLCLMYLGSREYQGSIGYLTARIESKKTC